MEAPNQKSRRERASRRDGRTKRQSREKRRLSTLHDKGFCRALGLECFLKLKEGLGGL